MAEYLRANVKRDENSVPVLALPAGVEERILAWQGPRIWDDCDDEDSIHLSTIPVAEVISDMEEAGYPIDTDLHQYIGYFHVA